MTILRTLLAYLAAVAGTYVLATTFYTQQVISKQAEIGAVYTADQQLDTYVQNFTGLTMYGFIIAIALLLGFLVAFGVKRILKPLAPIAYPVAGAAAMLVTLVLVEQQLGGGAGIIGGARDAFGLSLQCLAGFIGGGLFAMLRPR
jgi:hypothetical protein